jgi:uncharacterized protein (TIGR04222 family)
VRNPLDLAGPEFLVFYLVTTVLVTLALYSVRASLEGGGVPRLDTRDPYQIAFLRGGANEALRVATVMLIDRGLLVETDSGSIVATAKPEATRWPIERALLRHFAEPHLPTTIFGHPDLKEVCRNYEVRLVDLGLLPSAVDWRRRGWLLAVVLLTLIGLSAVKVFVALGRGHVNVGFLLVLTVVAIHVTCRVALPRLTTRGRLVLADLRRLFRRLRERAATVSAGGAAADAALLAAVFGLGVLPAAQFAYVHEMFPRAGDSSGGSCGSSCGSSCGGGGNGGGCGGCGGGGGD